MSDSVTDIALERAEFLLDTEYMKSEMEDDATYMKMFTEECRMEGTTVEEADAATSKEELEELDAAIERIQVDPNERYEQIMQLVNTDKEKVSVDEIMGIGDDDAEELAIAEMESWNDL